MLYELLLAMWCINVVFGICITSPVLDGDNRLIESTKMNLALSKLYDQYSKEFEISTAPGDENETNEYSAELYELYPRISNESHDLNKFQIQDLRYAHELETRSDLTEDNLTEYFTFVNTKLSAFINGLNYFNGYILQSTNRDLDDEEKFFLFGTILLDFSLAGIRGVTEKLCALLKQLNGGNEYLQSKILLDGVQGMQWVYDAMRNNPLKFLKDYKIIPNVKIKNKEKFRNIRHTELTHIGQQIEQLGRLLDHVKLKSQFKPSFTIEEAILDYKKGQKFWERADSTQNSFTLVNKMAKLKKNDRIADASDVETGTVPNDDDEDDGSDEDDLEYDIDNYYDQFVEHVTFIIRDSEIGKLGTMIDISETTADQMLIDEIKEFKVSFSDFPKTT